MWKYWIYIYKYIYINTRTVQTVCVFKPSYTWHFKSRLQSTSQDDLIKDCRFKDIYRRKQIGPRCLIVHLGRSSATRWRFTTVGNVFWSVLAAKWAWIVYHHDTLALIMLRSGKVSKTGQEIYFGVVSTISDNIHASTQAIHLTSCAYERQSRPASNRIVCTHEGASLQDSTNPAQFIPETQTERNAKLHGYPNSDPQKNATRMSSIVTITLS